MISKDLRLSTALSFFALTFILCQQSSVCIAEDSTPPVGKSQAAEDEQQASDKPADFSKVSPPTDPPISDTISEIDRDEIDAERRSLLEGVIRTLNSASWERRVRAGLSLKKVVRPADLRILADSLKTTTSTEGLIALIEIIGDLGDRRAVKTLVNELRAGRLQTQIAAARALGKLASDYQVPFLYQALFASSSDGAVEALRLNAASALGINGTARALSALQEGARHLTDGPFRAATYALKWARKEIRDEQIDTDLSYGRPLDRVYKGTQYMFYSPSVRSKNTSLKPWLMVCIHGSTLDYVGKFNECLPLAKRAQVALLSPSFDNLHFPHFEDLNFRGERADLRLLELIDHLTRYADLTTKEVYLYGVGYGGSFVQRFAMFHPERIARAVIHGRTVPMTSFRSDLYYPEGLKPTPYNPEMTIDIERALKADVSVIARVIGADVAQNRREFRFVQESIAEASIQAGRLSHTRFIPVEFNSEEREAREIMERELFPELTFISK